MILVVNLDRQPQRLRRTLRELNRFRTFDGISLISLTRRLAAIDARDGRAIAASADVDQNYCLGDQLFVQPDARLAECFSVKEPIRMTRQEVAIARSHIEAWKTIVASSCDYVLVLEDDIWFKPGAAAAIDRGWCAATKHYVGGEGPHLLYFSYENAGGTAEYVDICDDLFRPKRGLWFLSGYVLSREGAEVLLRSMPVIGPVDMWINYHFDKLGALALSSPTILQRPDGVSDNCYSALPYLARAGVIDAEAVAVPNRATIGPVFAWTVRPEREGLAMALSMLGLRVRAFDGDEEAIHDSELMALFEKFDAFVDAPLSEDAFFAAVSQTDARFILEAGAQARLRIKGKCLPPSRTFILQNYDTSDAVWQPLCALLGLARPPQSFPKGPPREWRVFRDDRSISTHLSGSSPPWADLMDESPWVLRLGSDWPSPPQRDREVRADHCCLAKAKMTSPTPVFVGLVETFPGNLAAFAREGLVHGRSGAQLVLSKTSIGDRRYRSGAFTSVSTFEHGRFEAEIKAARGSGLVTGFFLHRDSPRQEIDIELTGDDPRSMLVNVYFNPGDEGTTIGFGYRGSPFRINLGFDASLDFHLYAIEWRPSHISWLVDGRVVHERAGWDPTPIPHLPMRLHANLWAPRSKELAGRIDESALPSTAIFRNVAIWA